MTLNLVVAICGASGAVYAVRLLDVLLAAGCQVQLTISPAGQRVLEHELGLAVDLNDFRVDQLLPTPEQLADGDRYQVLRTLIPSPAWLGGRPETSGRKKSDRDTAVRVPGEIAYHHYQDLMSRLASGSSLTDGMVICPCSGGTLSAIAHAASGNLIHRAADVHLKERRKLVLVPRETPLSSIQLENMRRCVDAGAVVLPAMPGFYHGATTVLDLVDFVVARICDQLGVPQRLVRRWGEE
jgi:flavin prenyltransferase